MRGNEKGKMLKCYKAITARPCWKQKKKKKKKKALQICKQHALKGCWKV